MRKDLYDLKNLVTSKDGRCSKLSGNDVVNNAGESKEAAEAETPMNESTSSIEEFIVDPNSLPTSPMDLNLEDPTIQLK